ncbi:hypothetical protein [Neptuniibacter sp. QD37_11]|uniref:hypothetical protein n=1 Tax=Neptuniibacter sp. QD37_11 TaxID=3398209 RepID=UPI0039F48D92
MATYIDLACEQSLQQARINAEKINQKVRAVPFVMGLVFVAMACLFVANVHFLNHAAGMHGQHIEITALIGLSFISAFFVSANEVISVSLKTYLQNKLDTPYSTSMLEQACSESLEKLDYLLDIFPAIKPYLDKVMSLDRTLLKGDVEYLQSVANA